METVKEKSSENLHFSRTFIKVEGVNCSMTDVEDFTLVLVPDHNNLYLCEKEVSGIDHQCKVPVRRGNIRLAMVT